MNKNMIATAVFLIGLLIATVFIFLTGGNPLEPVPIPAETPITPVNTPVTINTESSPSPTPAGGDDQITQ